MTDYLQSTGIQVNLTGAGQHVPVIDWSYSQHSTVQLACYNDESLGISLVSSVSMMRCGTRVGNISPREAFTGRDRL
jgi:hypothetical protein